MFTAGNRFCPRRFWRALRPHFGLGALPTHVYRFSAEWHWHVHETRGWVTCAAVWSNVTNVYGVSVR